MERNVVERKYKDKLFRMIFKEKDKLLSLYNAVNKSNYTNPEDLQIVTLENAIYMNMKNDLAFLIDDSLQIYEHQSTVNPNMPLRDLIYVAKEYRKLIAEESLYSSEQIILPTPRFIVFYNGKAKVPEQQVLRLSDSYAKKTEDIGLELKVTVLNVNVGYNSELLEACQILKEYSRYVKKVRDYADKMELEEAVELAINESIKENILKEFLIKYRAEARAVCIFEYDEERELELMKKAERRQARREGLAEGLAEGLVEGDKKRVIEQVYKKVKKNKELEVIADELEENIEVIQPIYNIVKVMGEHYDCNEVYKVLVRNK